MVDAEVIERLKTLQDRYEPCGDYHKALGIAIKRMGEPERKTGKWEYVQYDGNPKIGNWHCSNCRVIVNSGFEGTPVFNYCPICGTKMEVDG